MINQLAVYSSNKKTTFKELSIDIQKYAFWIRKNTANNNISYAVGIKNHYDHWVMLLALISLGKECASIYDFKELPDELKSTFTCWIVDETKGMNEIETIFNPMTLNNIDNVEKISFDSFDDDQILKIHDSAKRLILTSGTTGRPKLVSLDALQLKNHLKDTEKQLNNTVNQHTKLLHLMGIDTMGGFLMPLVTWNRGGVVLMPSISEKNSSELNMPLFQSNMLCASPARLKSLLDQFPGVWPGRAQRTIRTAGSRLHTTLRDLLIEKMGKSVQITYGSTELGGVSSCDAMSLDIDPSSVGKIFDNVSVQIVDSNGNILANGQTGIVRCKTRSMVNQYSIGEKTLNFREGWFYPGDIGKITTEGWLSISGRISDVVNLGGHKVSALDLESKLTKIKEIDDVCVVSVNISGSDELAVVVVHKDSVDLKKIRQEIDLLMSEQINFHVIRVPLLPRNNMGKLLRNQISNKLSQMIAINKAI